MWLPSRFTCSVGNSITCLILALFLGTACSTSDGADTSDSLAPPSDGIDGTAGESDNSSCVRCHTDKELLEELAPPREVEEEEGGGG